MRPAGEIRAAKRDAASGLARGISLISLGQWRRAGSRAMTALGQKRKSAEAVGMSEAGGKADIDFGSLEVCL